MKVINEKDYSYLGTSRGWHVFLSRKSNYDPELLYVYRARMNMKDGSFKFYDPVKFDETFKEQDCLLLNGSVQGLAYSLGVNVDFESEEVSCVCKPGMKLMA